MRGKEERRGCASELAGMGKWEGRGCVLEKEGEGRGFLCALWTLKKSSEALGIVIQSKKRGANAH